MEEDDVPSLEQAIAVGVVPSDTSLEDWEKLSPEMRWEIYNLDY